MQVRHDQRIKQSAHRLTLGRTYQDIDLVFPNEFGRVPIPWRSPEHRTVQDGEWGWRRQVNTEVGKTKGHPRQVPLLKYETTDSEQVGDEGGIQEMGYYATTVLPDSYLIMAGKER